MTKAVDINLSIGAATDVGKVRRLNEDSIGTPQLMGVPEERQGAQGELFVVADGMGGHAAGEVASQMAVQVVYEEYYAAGEAGIAANLSRAMESANSRILAKAAQDIEQGGMGTTLVAAVVHGDELTVANVGDSRAYLVRNRRIRQVSRDHSWVAESVAAGLISESSAHSHPQRGLITRSLGSSPKVDVDIFRERLQPGDGLVLCSDGLTNEVGDPAILEIVRQNDAPMAAKLLVDEANQDQSRDNISVIVAKVLGGRAGKRFLGPLLALAALAALAAVLLFVFRPWNEGDVAEESLGPTPSNPSGGAGLPLATWTPFPTESISSAPSQIPDALQSPLEPVSPLPTPRPLPPVTPTPIGLEAFQAGPEAPIFPTGPVGIREAWVCEGGTCDDREALRVLGQALGYPDEASAKPQLWLQASSDGLLQVMPQRVESCLFGAVNPSSVPESEPTFDLVSDFAYTVYTQSPTHNYITALVLGGYVKGGFRPVAGIACKGERYTDCMSFLPPEADYAQGPKHVWFQGDDCQRWAPLADLEIGDRSFLVHATWEGPEDYAIPGAIGQVETSVFVWNEESQVYAHYADLSAGGR